MFRLFIFSVFTALLSFNQVAFALESDTDRLLSLLVDKKVISADDAAGFRADLAVAKQDEKEKQKDFNVLAGRAIKLNGYTQLRYRQDRTLNDGFDLRRVRLGLTGDINELFDYQFQGEYAGSSAKLLDGVIGYKLNPSIKLNLGQQKLPFSQENLASDSKSDTINRSQVVEALLARGTDVIGNQNGRDIGIAASGSFFNRGDDSLFDYSLGIFNGSGINVTDTNERKDFVGRLVAHPLKNWSLGSSLYSGKYTLSTSPNTQAERSRIGGEFAYVDDTLSLKGEYIAGRDGTIAKDGWYIQGGYFLIPKKFQGVLKFDTYDPNRKIARNVTRVYTVGSNWYFNKWAGAQINYEFKDETGKELNNNALTGQLTVQF